MRSFVSNLPAADTQVALVDDDRVLAASTPIKLGLALGGIDERSDAVVALERAHQGLENPGCALSIQTDSISESGSYCVAFSWRARCASWASWRRWGLHFGVRLRARNSTQLFGGWRATTIWLEVKVASSSDVVLPKTTSATYCTLIASAISSIFVAVMLTRVVWLYDRSSDTTKSKGKVTLFASKCEQYRPHSATLHWIRNVHHGIPHLVLPLQGSIPQHA